MKGSMELKKKEGERIQDKKLNIAEQDTKHVGGRSGSSEDGGEKQREMEHSAAHHLIQWTNVG